MYTSSTLLVLSLAALSQARFGQENAVQAIIAAVTTGDAGEAATLAGQSISTLLAGSNACDKLTLADQVAALGGADAIAAAAALVQAEKNFNPFAADGPNVCSDATLPATEELRGIIPLVDPDLDGAAAVNEASAASLDAPVDQAGSTADLLTDLGFSAFTAQAADGAAGDAAAGDAAADDAAADDAAADDAAADDAGADDAGADDAAADDAAADDAAAVDNGAAAGNGTAAADAADAGADDAAADDGAAANDMAADDAADDAAADDAAADDAAADDAAADDAAADDAAADDAAADDAAADDAAADDAAADDAAADDAAADDAAADDAAADDAAAAGGDLQTFTGAVGGAAADPITNSGNADRPFEVAGSTFVNFSAAAARTCDRQFNACANAANSGAADIAVADCTAQKDECTAAQDAAAVTSFKKRALSARAQRAQRREVVLRRRAVAGN